MSNLFFVVAWIVSVLGSLLLGAVAVTYVRRTWQLIRSEEDDPTRERLLDGLDHLQNQMHLISGRLSQLDERLDGIEGRLEPGSRPELPAGSSDPPREPDDPGHTDPSGRRA